MVGTDSTAGGTRLVTATDVEVTGREPDADAGSGAEAVAPGPGEPCPVCGEPDCEKLCHSHLSSARHAEQ